MARIKTGPIVSDVSGKLGDNIFSRNKYGPYVKAFAAPTIPPSSYFTASQQAMIDATAAWLTLSDSEVLAYAKFSEQWPRKSFHDGYVKLDSRALFISCYINQVYAGISPDPLPIAPDVVDMRSVSIDATTFDALNIKVTGGSNSSDYYTLLYATFPHPLGVRSVNTPPFYFFDAVTYFQGSPVNFATSYKSRLGGVMPAETERVFVKAKVIHKLSGLIVAEFWNHSIGYPGGTPFILGNNTIGASIATSTLARANRISPSGNGFIDSISLYHGGGAGNCQLGIYDNAGGNINNLLAATPITGLSGSLGWQKINLSSPLAISSGSLYWIGYITTGTLNKYYDALGGVADYQSLSTTPLPNPFIPTSSRTYNHSLFCEGTYS